MTENWLTPTLCSFDEKVRVERGPQVIELECNDANLSDAVTAPHYKIGGRDAEGRIIRPNDAGPESQKQSLIDGIETYGVDGEKARPMAVNVGDKMRCVDYKAKQAPWMWKVYKAVETDQLNRKTGEYETITKFIKVEEHESQDYALDRAAQIYKEMN